MTEVSDWSDFALVYTTNPSRPVEDFVPSSIAIIGIRSFQTNGQFSYVTCNTTSHPLPSGVTAAQVEAAIEEWETAVRWDDGSGSNIVRVSGTTSTMCADPRAPMLASNQVIFMDNKDVDDICDGEQDLACWDPRPEGTRVSPEVLGSIVVLRASINWSSSVGSGSCLLLHTVLVHESGHSFGLAHAPEHLSHSIMSLDPTNLCKPTAYDVVAMMANYQSR